MEPLNDFVEFRYIDKMADRIKGRAKIQKTNGNIRRTDKRAGKDSKATYVIVESSKSN